MQTAIKQSRASNIGKADLVAVNSRICLQIRETLDAIFAGIERLETTPAAIKQNLLSHLQNCDECCRAFDARARFRSPGRDRIF